MEAHVKMENIGFVGLGKMGGSICNALIGRGHRVAVFDVFPAAAEKYRDKARIAGDVTEVLEGNDYIFLSLPSSKEVEPIVETFLNMGVAGKTIIDLSTSYPLSTRRLYERVKAGGGVFVDAPLSGTPGDAEKGTLCVLFGGDHEQYRRLEPLMRCFCNRYYYLGASGAGHTAKLIMNFIALSYVISYAQAFPLAEKMGLDKRQLFEIVSTTGMNCGMFQFYAPKMIAQTYDKAFALEFALKDFTYCKKLYEEFQVPGFALDGAIDLLRVGVKDGRAQGDFSEAEAIVRSFFAVR